jgi:hypothetical protein
MMLTAFLAIIGFGYLAAIANIYHRHAQADGKSGISMDDIRAVYRGLRVAGGDASPSRMLTMIRGEMRQYLSSDADFSVLESWLKNGGKPENLDAGKGRRTPRKVIIRNCLRCHAATSGTDISRQSALGKDEFDVDPSMIARFVSSPTSQPGGIAHAPPQYTIPRLVLVSHQHMLSIPLFTLVVALLFAMTRLPSGVRHVLTPVPMIALIFDFGGWWLARVSDIGVYSLAAAGAAFGLVFGLQIIVVVIDLWRPSTTPPPWA